MKDEPTDSLPSSSHPTHATNAQRWKLKMSSSAAKALGLRPCSSNVVFANAPAILYSVARAALTTAGGVWRIW